MRVRLILLLGLFLPPLSHAPAIVIRHDRDDARYHGLMERRGWIEVVGYREAAPRLVSARARAEKCKDDTAFTNVLDQREKDKINWIRVRALPRWRRDAAAD